MLQNVPKIQGIISIPKYTQEKNPGYTFFGMPLYEAIYGNTLFILTSFSLNTNSFTSVNLLMYFVIEEEIRVTSYYFFLPTHFDHHPITIIVNHQYVKCCCQNFIDNSMARFFSVYNR